MGNGVGVQAGVHVDAVVDGHLFGKCMKSVASRGQPRPNAIGKPGPEVDLEKGRHGWLRAACAGVPESVDEATCGKAFGLVDVDDAGVVLNPRVGHGSEVHVQQPGCQHRHLGRLGNAVTNKTLEEVDLLLRRFGRAAESGEGSVDPHHDRARALGVVVIVVVTTVFTVVAVTIVASLLAL